MLDYRQYGKDYQVKRKESMIIFMYFIQGKDGDYIQKNGFRRM